MTMNNDGNSFFAQFIGGPENEQRESEIVQRGPQPIIPPAHPRSLSSEKLLDWVVNHWTRPTISARDICRYGPNSIRDRKSAIDQAEILAKHGWLTPIKTRRRDMREWQIIRQTSR
jgi:hypothetical protein